VSRPRSGQKIGKKRVDKNARNERYRPPNSRSTSQPSNPFAASGRTEAEARVGVGLTAVFAATGALTEDA